MSTLSTARPTLLDWARSRDPNGKTAEVVELLNQSNEMLIDMVWIEANEATGNKSSIRTGLPTPTWRKLYQGIQPNKSQRATIVDTVGMLEARAEVDCDLADLEADQRAFRLSEGQAFLEGMNQEFQRGLLYESQNNNPERITGLTPRYSTISGATNGQNIVNGGGSGSDNTSVWLIVWGKQTVAGIFPKGSMAGLKHEDLGIDDAFDSNNNRYRAYMDRWTWKCGLMVKDWRYAVRIANIDVSDLLAASGTQANTAATFLPKLMVKACARIPSMGMGSAVFYANRTVKEMLSVNAMDKSQNILSIQDGFNQFGTVGPGSVAGTGTGISGGTLKLLGVPVRTVDQILNTETVVS